MDNKTDFNSIKSLTRLALPDDNAYIFRLGVALYGFASLSGFMAEVACHLDNSLDQQKIESGTGGQILKSFRRAVQTAKKTNPTVEEPGKIAASLFQALNTLRSDFVHSYPITNGMDEQILHRRDDSKGKYFEVNNEFLNNFIAQLADVSSTLYEIRSAIRKNRVSASCVEGV